MSEIQIFNNPSFGQIRTVSINDEPWFVGKDVAEVLGYANPKNAVPKHVDEEDKLSTQIEYAGQKRTITIINESGLYSLILSSKLPNAKEFKRWVTSEVLPSIRKNGGYIVGQKELSPEELMAKALMVAQQTLANREVQISELTVQNKIMAPKAEYFDEMVDRNLLTNFRETAKELGIKQKFFVNWLLDHRFIYRDKRGKIMPYANKNDGLFEIKECFNNKTQWAGTQTLVTPKGRETFRLLILGE